MCAELHGCWISLRLLRLDLQLLTKSGYDLNMAGKKKKMGAPKKDVHRKRVTVSLTPLAAERLFHVKSGDRSMVVSLLIEKANELPHLS